jgi:hypothetical protein
MDTRISCINNNGTCSTYFFNERSFFLMKNRYGIIGCTLTITAMAVRDKK